MSFLTSTTKPLKCELSSGPPAFLLYALLTQPSVIVSVDPVCSFNLFKYTLTSRSTLVHAYIPSPSFSSKESPSSLKVESFPANTFPHLGRSR